MDASLLLLGQTERLTVRAPTPEDLKAIVALWTDPQVTEHVGGPRDPSVVRDYFEQYAADPEALVGSEHDRWWSIVERASGEPIGLTGLLEKEVEGRIESELNYYLLQPYWGQGYATEAAQLVVDYAFTHLNLDSIIAIIGPENQASAQVARRLGMHLDRKTERAEGMTKEIYRLRRPA